MKIKEAQKGLFLLPSLFSLANLFFGFMSILLTFHGRYRMAAIWIILAALMDALDGLVARATHTPSEFGVELDSLADAVSFGLATSVLLYFWSLEVMGPPGVFFSFIFLTAAVLRLARYNVRTRVQTDRKHYQGLTVPSAAIFMASVVNFRPIPAGTRGTAILVAGLIILVSLCMVSSIPYKNFIKSVLERRVNIKTAFILAILLVGVIFYTRVGLVVFFGLNALSGPANALLRGLKKDLRKKSDPKDPLMAGPGADG